MTDRALVLDTTASRLVVRTRATGMLARLAHDLELVSKELRGTSRIGEAAWSAELVVSASSIHVVGALHGDRLDPNAISSSDRVDIERRMRSDALGAAQAITISLRGETRVLGEAALSIGRGPRVRVSLLDLRALDREDGSIAVSGRADLSLRALGVAEIRAPLGAFKVSDRVEVVADLVLKPS